MNQRTMWAENSTAIPTVITKFTRETALALIFRAAITPSRLVRIIITIMITMVAPHILRPSIPIVTRYTAPVISSNNNNNNNNNN